MNGFLRTRQIVAHRLFNVVVRGCGLVGRIDLANGCPDEGRRYFRKR